MLDAMQDETRRKKAGTAGATTTTAAPVLTPQMKARIALQRFGLGAKPGGTAARLAASANAARDALLAELDTPNIALISDPALPTYAAACALGTTGFSGADTLNKQELRARYAKHLAPEIGFVERLVLFWSNHFSMNRGKNDVVRATIGQWERDVIRKTVLGKFSDMLLAVFQHPAMITYLDNQKSYGPNSPIGKGAHFGYNENLARETLELHTLGVGGPYTQADVTNFANVLTGWSYVSKWEADNGWLGATQAVVGQFVYRDQGHEPGPFTVLGRSWPATGQQQGLAVLRMLAAHPATAQHLAFRMLVHFVTDAPTAAMVKTLVDAFTRSGGDLKAMARALVLMPEAWSAPLSRIRTPYLSMVAQLRASGKAVDTTNENAVNWALSTLNHAPWQCLTPDGYPDESFAWINPDAVRVREDAAYMVAGMVQSGYAGPAPKDLAAQLYPGSLSAASLQAVTLWPDTRRGLATLFMTPEFLRS
ncbi:DUF1800 domain-containing protein [Prosthecomicrobium sp. N25]|uniref:DUF1800 domain-containing protein n=1 Tax=Prosthecomicrobium sp. N25 TaxID=3129254 RepID=UPI003077D52E